MSRLPLLILPVLMMAGCQSGPVERQPEGIAAYVGDPRLGERAKDICFASGIDSFSMNRDRSLVLRRGMDEFLVEVYGPCPELAYALNIGIGSATGCLTRGDALLVSSSLHGTGRSGIGPDRCIVKDIYHWDSKKRGPESDEPSPAGQAENSPSD